MIDELAEGQRLFDQRIEFVRIEETDLRSDIGEADIVFPRFFLISFDVDDRFETIPVSLDVTGKLGVVVPCPL